MVQLDMTLNRHNSIQIYFLKLMIFKDTPNLVALTRCLLKFIVVNLPLNYQAFDEV